MESTLLNKAPEIINYKLTKYFNEVIKHSYIINNLSEALNVVYEAQELTLQEKIHVMHKSLLSNMDEAMRTQEMHHDFKKEWRKSFFRSVLLEEIKVLMCSMTYKLYITDINNGNIDIDCTISEMVLNDELFNTEIASCKERFNNIKAVLDFSLNRKIHFAASMASLGLTAVLAVPLHMIALPIGLSLYALCEKSQSVYEKQLETLKGALNSNLMFYNITNLDIFLKKMKEGKLSSQYLTDASNILGQDTFNKFIILHGSYKTLVLQINDIIEKIYPIKRHNESGVEYESYDESALYAIGLQKTYNYCSERS